MSATTRSIVADCTSGDGSQLTITTEVQDEEVALSFTIKPGADGMQATVRVSSEALVELIGFQSLENAGYRAEYVTADQDEKVPF